MVVTYYKLLFVGFLHMCPLRVMSENTKWVKLPHIVLLLTAPFLFKDLFPCMQLAVHTVWQGWLEVLMDTNKMGKKTSRANTTGTCAQVRGWCLETDLVHFWTSHTFVTHGYLMSWRVQLFRDGFLVPPDCVALASQAPQSGRPARAIPFLGTGERLNISSLWCFARERGHEVLHFMEKAGLFHVQ